MKEKTISMIVDIDYEIRTGWGYKLMNREISNKNIFIDSEFFWGGKNSKHNPLMFFGYVSAILLLLALGFFIPVWREYLLTGLVERFPTLIVCGSAAIARVLCLFAGIILETLIQKDRQQFEFRLQITEMMYKSLKRDN